MKDDKHKEIDYGSISSKEEKREFSRKIVKQYNLEKPPSKIKLFFGWIAWLLIYGVGVAFVFYMIYLMSLKPSPETNRLNNHLSEIYKSRN